MADSVAPPSFAAKVMTGLPLSKLLPFSPRTRSSCSKTSRQEKSNTHQNSNGSYEEGQAKAATELPSIRLLHLIVLCWYPTLAKPKVVVVVQYTAWLILMLFDQLVTDEHPERNQ